MGKQVKDGEDGDLGKALAGQKRGLEETGEMVVGRMATRSATKAKKVGDELVYKMFEEWAEKNKKIYKTGEEKKQRFQIWRSTKEWVDAKNSVKQPGGVRYGLTFLSDLMPREKYQFRGRRKKPVDHARKEYLRTLDFWDTELGKELTQEKEAFDKWVAEHKINYDSEHERTKRCQFYFRNKKKIKLLREHKPGCYLNLPDELDMKMDQDLPIPEFHRLVNLKPGPSNN